jgi:hypothetical protein
LDAEPEALSDTGLGVEPDIEPDTELDIEPGCVVALLDSNRRKGLNDDETLLSVQNGNHKAHPPGGQSLVYLKPDLLSIRSLVKLLFYRETFHH